MSINEEGRAKVSEESMAGVEVDKLRARAKDGKHDGSPRPNRPFAAQRSNTPANSRRRVRRIERIARGTNTDGPVPVLWVRAGQATTGDTSRGARKAKTGDEIRGRLDMSCI